MTDLLLIFGLFGACVELLIAIVAVRWVYQRPRRMMHWAVRARAEMTRLESVMWLAARRGRRAVRLFLVAVDELSPALAGASVAMRELGEAMASAEREAQ